MAHPYNFADYIRLGLGRWQALQVRLAQPPSGPPDVVVNMINLTVANTGTTQPIWGPFPPPGGPINNANCQIMSVHDPPTQGYWYNAINPQTGLIVGVENYRLNSQRHWEDVIFLSWQAILPVQPLSNLRFMVRANAASDEIEQLMDDVYRLNGIPLRSAAIQTWLPPAAGTPLANLTNREKGFCATLFSPNVRGLPVLLTQHAIASNQKTIQSIQTSYYNLAWAILVTMV